MPGPISQSYDGPMDGPTPLPPEWAFSNEAQSKRGTETMATKSKSETKRQDAGKPKAAKPPAKTPPAVKAKAKGG